MCSMEMKFMTSNELKRYFIHETFLPPKISEADLCASITTARLEIIILIYSFQFMLKRVCGLIDFLIFTYGGWLHWQDRELLLSDK